MAVRIIVLMGVSGAGKSTVGLALAQRLSWPFEEGDRFHPAANIEKMKSGRPLNDADRAPWLSAIAAWIDEALARGETGVVACSALKRAYRERLTAGRPQVAIVFLEGPKALIAHRVARRTGHFMPPALLDSQFADLEPPSADENALVVDVAQSVEAQVQAIIEGLGLTP
ncbi:MAG TPA: gluconokinase [Caulobacteraceae bacterium]|nr:gluconokinase [Caulobacteraceae bacterium]